MFTSRCRNRELHDIRYFPRVPRTITLKKGSSGFGFNIVGGNDGEGIFVSFVLTGGPADLSGEIKRGDRILAVNGIDTTKATHQQAALTLKGCRGDSVVELVAQYCPEKYNALEARTYEQLEKVVQKQRDRNLYTTQNKTLHVRALFDYDPTKDSDLPSHGLAFKYGDILHLTNASDEEWWKAMVVASCFSERRGTAGIIPSKQRVERKERARIRSVRFRCASVVDHALVGSVGVGRRNPALFKMLGLKKDKHCASESGLVERNCDEGPDTVSSYEEVMPQQLKHARPVILLGHLKDSLSDNLLQEEPDRFCTCSTSLTAAPLVTGSIPLGDIGPSGGTTLAGPEAFVLRPCANSRPVRTLAARPTCTRTRSPLLTFGDAKFKQKEDSMRRGPDEDLRNGCESSSRALLAHLCAEVVDDVNVASVRKLAASGRHCILNVSVRAVNRLQTSGLFPISIFVRPQSFMQILESNPNMSGFQAKDEYESCLMLEREFTKQFTAIVEGSCPQLIYEHVKDVIRDQSSSTVWVPITPRQHVLTTTSKSVTFSNDSGNEHILDTLT